MDITRAYKENNMELSKKQIYEIAEELEMGLICYVHKETKKIIVLPDFDDPLAVDEDVWAEPIEEIESNFQDYEKIEKMSSREGFRIMADFTEQVTNKEIKSRLIYALERGKPFRNFKYEVDYNEDVRQQWFLYKNKRYQEYVKQYFLTL